MEKIVTIILLSLLTVQGCWFEKENADDMVEELSEEELQTLIEASDSEVVESNEELQQEIDLLIGITGDENATIESCETIVDADIKESCEQKFVYEGAVAKGDEDMCAELLNEYDREKCAEEVNK